MFSIELSEFIEKYCKLSPNITARLEECGIDMSTLVEMTLEDFDTFNVNLNKVTTKRLYFFIQKFSAKSHKDSESEQINQKKRKHSGSDSHPEKLKLRRTNESSENQNLEGTSDSESSPESNISTEQGRKNDSLQNITTNDSLNSNSQLSQLSIDKSCEKFQRSNSSTSTIQKKFPHCFRLTWDNICAESIRTILGDSLEGLSILGEYEQEGILISSSRKELCSLIVNRCEPKLPYGASKFFEKVAKCIIDLMPNENIYHYYIAPYSQGNERKDPKGCLCDKYRNTISRLIANKCIQKNSRKKSVDTIVRQEASEDVKHYMKWLGKHREPWDDVKKYWTLTHDFRLSSNGLQKNMIENIFEKEWPILKSNIEPQLVELDFNSAYPNSSLSFEKNWEQFFNDLFTLRRKSIRNDVGISICKHYEECLELKNEVACEYLRIFLIPYLVPPTARISTKSGSKKPSIIESAQGLYVWCKTAAGVDKALQERAQRYTTWKITVQPCLVLVGEGRDSIDQIYIDIGINEYRWKFQSVSRALDVLFQLFIIFNLEYPRDCEHIWVLIQHLVYDINTVWDKKLVNVLSIETALEHLRKKLSSHK